MYIVYKTTNLVNGKFYIGVHKKNKGGYIYLGSGTLLKKAIKKYGRENFIRETLREFYNEQDAYDYEKELVNETMINDPLCYNIIDGGGLPPNFKGKYHPWFNRHHSNESKKKMSETKKKIFLGENNPFWGKSHSKKTKNIISEKQKNNLNRLGLHHSKETKKKISDSKKGKTVLLQCGINNSRSFIWYIKENTFNSSREAARFFNVSQQSIINWCKSSKRPDCYSSPKGEK